MVPSRGTMNNVGGTLQAQAGGFFVMVQIAL